MTKKSRSISTVGTGSMASGGGFEKLSTMGNTIVDIKKLYKIVGIAVAAADGRAWGFETDGDITIPFGMFYNSKLEGRVNTNVGQFLTDEKSSDNIRKALDKGISLEGITFSFTDSKVKMVRGGQRYDITSYPMFDTFPLDDYDNHSTALQLQKAEYKSDKQRQDMFRKLYAGTPKEGHGHPILAYDYTLAIQGEVTKLDPAQLKEAKAALRA